MLSKQMWISLAPHMVTEWTQCMEQGLDVEQYGPVCREIAQKGKDWEELARVTAARMEAAPLRPDYPYDEPSDLAGILAARPNRRHSLKPAAPGAVADKIRGAWLGRIAGCLLGKPVEGMRRPMLYGILKGTDNYPMHKYIRKGEFGPAEEELASRHWGSCWADTLDGAAPEDDDTNYTVFALKLLQCYGRDFTPDDVLEGWMRFIPYLSLCTAERVAYRNGAMGLLPPETAVYANPFREWIGAQIRGDFFGYINPGDPAAAAEMAWRDASISHIKNGIYGEMFCSAMTAAAA
ncbi:MAG: ADP-ribosylglycohydrolase family protein, partial [Oscillospiraceae bacterium]|nr:ADP-ribosylglycohydrolase family protein [Oscillospiraceae bacterium]